MELVEKKCGNDKCPSTFKVLPNSKQVYCSKNCEMIAEGYDWKRFKLVRYCLICGTNRYVHKHHIRTRAAGGSNDDLNLVNLCFNHHTEIHKIGKTKFCKKYPKFERMLSDKGWYYDSNFNKWFNKNMEETCN